MADDMSLNSQGYVKLWRKTLDNVVLKNANVAQLFLYCLLKASHREHEMLVGCQLVHLLPGQFIFGRKKAAEELNSTEQQIRTALKILEKLNFLTIKPTNKFSIVSIINWSTYQESDCVSNQQNPNKQPTSNQQATTNKNGKNGKNNISISPPIVGDTLVDAAPDVDPQQGRKAIPPCPHQKIVQLYHDALPELPRVKCWNKTREDHMRARWRESCERKQLHTEAEGLDYFARLFAYIHDSDFLMGRVQRGDRTWQADFDWLIKPTNFAKVIEGRYHEQA